MNALRWLLPLWTFFSTQVVYLRTLDPIFPNDDSAETITAGVTLGIQHPPSYALAALVDRVFSFFLVGNPAFSINWGSSLIASLNAALLTAFLLCLFDRGWFLSTLSKSQWVTRIAAVLGGWALAFSPIFWTNALSAKGGLYHLSLTFTLGLFFLILPDPEAFGTPQSALAALYLGLGLTGHWETFIIIFPATLLFILTNRRSSIKSWVMAGTFFLIGISAFLYLPLRARFAPALNLGDPDRVARFWADLTRRYFTGREENLLYATLHGIPNHLVLDQMGFLGGYLWDNLGLLWGFLAFLGLGLWLTQREKRAALFGGVFLVCFLGVIFLLMTTVAGNQKFVMDLSAALFLGAGGGLAWVATEPKIKQGPLFLAMAAVILFMDTATAFLDRDQSRVTLVHDYGVELLHSLPRNSLFFAESDPDYFSLYYLQRVRGLRPDVAMIPSFTLFETWGVGQVERQWPQLGLTASARTFPDPIARCIYATSELVVKDRDRRPIGYSNFDGAFHRYYLNLQKNLQVKPSGSVWLLACRPVRRFTGPALSSLRQRGFEQNYTRQEDSLKGLRQVYTSIGLWN